MVKSSRPVATTLAVVLLAFTDLSAQKMMRISGRVRAETGAAIESAQVRTDALAGIRGAPFTGGRKFAAKSNREGYWALNGIERGVWIFEVSHPKYLPHVVAIPIGLVQAPDPNPPSWVLSVELQPRPDPDDVIGRLLGEAVDAIAAGRPEVALATVQRLYELDLNPEAACAAGDICLLLRRREAASVLFSRAAAARPDWYRPQLGLASAAIMGMDYDSSTNAYRTTRELSRDADLQRTLSAVVFDLSKILKLDR